MQRLALPLLSAVLLLPLTGNTASPATQPADAPAYTPDGRLLAPQNYREWVFLSSGFNMSYLPPEKSQGMGVFDNVFVSPAAYRAFVSTGSWPDKTVFILETRQARNRGSINQAGHYQGANLMGLEAHVKDETRFPAGWAFFDFNNPSTGALLPRAAACYACHQQHGAVDTTFVQFYPTLIGIATDHKTLSPAYLKESSGAAPASGGGHPSGH